MVGHRLQELRDERFGLSDQYFVVRSRLLHAINYLGHRLLTVDPLETLFFWLMRKPQTIMFSAIGDVSAKFAAQTLLRGPIEESEGYATLLTAVVVEDSSVELTSFMAEPVPMRLKSPHSCSRVKTGRILSEISLTGYACCCARTVMHALLCFWRVIIPRLSSQNFVVLCKTLLLQTCQKPTNTINKKFDLRDLVEQGPELVHSREPQDAM
jgi:hypothetical protein